MIFLHNHHDGHEQKFFNLMLRMLQRGSNHSRKKKKRRKGEKREKKREEKERGKTKGQKQGKRRKRTGERGGGRSQKGEEKESRGQGGRDHKTTLRFTCHRPYIPPTYTAFTQAGLLEDHSIRTYQKNFLE